MRHVGIRVLVVAALALAACRTQTEQSRQLVPLPGVTTASTVLAPTTTVDLTATTTIVVDATSTSVAVAGWPFEGFTSVLRMGGEAARGSGCGADTTVGEVIPDGWWLGIITADGNSQMQVDLVCAYRGTAAQTLIDECLTSDAAATCTDYFDESFWPVNRNGRQRTVPKSSSLVTEAVDDLCNVGAETRDGGITGELDWLQIQGGSVIYIRRSCNE
ncbi:MAG TPA: hypothetical protein PK020_08505 [Ilumatobacteraceae bacterium]|nr:hypothetical protein [Ilumatobacteraceae bacterium]HRB03264.1 hypothetical protein [Ilumatobacteraceae bacterium]